jgi:hypothetical protein
MRRLAKKNEFESSTDIVPRDGIARVMYRLTRSAKLPCMKSQPAGGSAEAYLQQFVEG